MHGFFLGWREVVCVGGKLHGNNLIKLSSCKLVLGGVWWTAPIIMLQHVAQWQFHKLRYHTYVGREFHCCTLTISCRVYFH